MPPATFTRSPMADWRPLQSTSLTGYRYDPETRSLDIRFASGRTYTLEGVPAGVAEGLESAPSAGTYFNTHLRGQY